MSRFSEQDSIDPDNPELDYSPRRLSERAAKLGPSVSQRARSETVRLSPEALAPRHETARRTPDLGRRAALVSVAARFAAVVGAVAVVALLLVIIMKPASRQSVASSTPSDTTGSTPQSNQGDGQSKPPLAELEAPLALPPSQPTTHEQSQQLLQRFLQWREKADATESSASSVRPQ
jgi:hypothetical protein